MKTTYRYLAYSVLESLKETSDDADIRINTIIFWSQVVSNRLMAQRLEKRKLQSGEFLSHIQITEILTAGKRKYFVLPASVLDLSNDNGISQLTYSWEDLDNPLVIPFEKTTPAKLWSLYSIPIRKPNPKKPYLSRQKDKMYLYGVEDINITELELWLYTSVDTSRIINLDTELELAEDQVESLIKEVSGLTRYTMLLEKNKENTGSDNNTGVKNKTAIASYQDNTQQQPNQEQ